MKNEYNSINILLISGFDYVCSHPPPAKICFGTSLQREILPTFGPSLNSFMARLTIKPTSNTAKLPSVIRKTDTILKKNNSKKIGFGPLANKTPRIKPTSNDLRPFYSNHQLKVFKKNIKPFGVGFDRNSIKTLMLTPAPCTYKQFQKENYFKSSFGGQRKELPAVEMICNPTNLSICEICDEIPFGDYWRHLKSLKDLCRGCMEKEIENAIYRSITKSLKIKRLGYLQEYQVYISLYWIEFFFDLFFFCSVYVIVIFIMIIRIQRRQLNY